VRGPCALALLLLVLLAAGCGVRNSKPFNAENTAGCMAKHHFTDVTTDKAKIGLIAAFAPRGGLRATAASGNVVTIAFAEDAKSVGSTVEAFRKFASPFYKRHLSDILQTDRNAVLIWTTTPLTQELQDAEFCLRS
jgi:hypothetical protein